MRDKLDTIFDISWMNSEKIMQRPYLNHREFIATLLKIAATYNVVPNSSTGAHLVYVANLLFAGNFAEITRSQYKNTVPINSGFFRENEPREFIFAAAIAVTMKTYVRVVIVQDDSLVLGVRNAQREYIVNPEGKETHWSSNAPAEPAVYYHYDQHQITPFLRNTIYNDRNIGRHKKQKLICIRYERETISI